MTHDAGSLNGDERRNGGPLIGGRYRLGERIGSGRLGGIYDARDEAAHEPSAGRVAVQLLERRLASRTDFIAGLERGCNALRAAKHPNIVALFEFGRDERVCFLVMERLDGASLRFVLEEAGTLPAEEAMPVIRLVGDALGYLHAKGFGHGNVIPESVLVTYDYGVKLLDLVPAVPPPGHDDATDAGLPVCRDVRDDVFGLACLSYELMAGRHPFNFNSAEEARRARLEPAPIEGLPTRQWEALRRALIPERAQRTQTVAAFLIDFGVPPRERSRFAQPSPSSGPAPATASGPAPVTEAPRMSRSARVARSDPIERPVPRAARLEAPHGNRRVARLALATAAVAAALAAGAWALHDPLRREAASWIATIEARFGAGGRERADEGPTEIVVEPSPVASAGSTSAETATGTASRARGEAAGPATPSAVTVAPGPDVRAARGAERSVPVTPSEQTPGPADGRPESRISPERAAAQASARPAREGPVASAETRPSPAVAPTLTLADSSVSAREGDTAARISVRRTGDAADAFGFVWWTSDETAAAGDDYAGVAERPERFAPGQRELTLYIPLVDDALPEPPESFYVYVGRADTDEGRLEPLGQVRVNLIDDD